MMFLLEILAAYLPFQMAINPSRGVDLASIRIFIIIMFLLWLAEGLKKKKINVVPGPITIFLITFLFISGISFIWAVNEDWAIRKILFLASIFPLYFVASDIISDKEKVFRIIKILSVSGALVAAVGIIQYICQFIFGLDAVYNFWAKFLTVPFLGKNAAEAVLLNPSWLVNISGRTFLRATSVFPDPHMLSLYLGMLIPMSAGIFLKEKKFLYFFIFLILLFGDVLTFSRGGYLGLLAGAIFLVIVFWKNLPAKYKIFILSFFVVVVLFFMVPGPVANRFSSIFNVNEGSNSGRLDMWRKSAQVALNNPFLGVGIGNYPLEIKPSASYREPITSHNTYLDIASETGIINAAIWIFLLILACISFLQKSKKDNFFIMPAASLVFFSGHQIAETAIYSPMVLTLFIIILSFTNVEKS
ncbi:MAG TPA: O-antigen ligase family protein [Patescibacteria group bacterium]|nr:O-antigen ligase family protein [Patescibacteria group bacterium]